MALVVSIWRADTAGAGSHEEDQLLSEVPDLPPDEHTSMQFDDTQMESPAAQQLTAQPATKDVETASDASGLTEDSMQADAAQPSSVDATKEGSDEKDDALGVTPAGTSGAAVQEAPSNDSPPYPGQGHAQDMLYAACNGVGCIQVSCGMCEIQNTVSLTDPRHAQQHMHAFA